MHFKNKLRNRYLQNNLHGLITFVIRPKNIRQRLVISCLKVSILVGTATCQKKKFRRALQPCRLQMAVIYRRTSLVAQVAVPAVVEAD